MFVCDHWQKKRFTRLRWKQFLVWVDILLNLLVKMSDYITRPNILWSFSLCRTFWRSLKYSLLKKEQGKHQVPCYTCHDLYYPSGESSLIYVCVWHCLINDKENNCDTLLVITASDEGRTVTFIKVNGA